MACFEPETKLLSGRGFVVSLEEEVCKRHTRRNKIGTGFAGVIC